MKQRHFILILGIALMILSTPQFANAQDIAYTKDGWVACKGVYFGDMRTFWRQKDWKAVDEMVEMGSCIWLKPGVQVYFKIDRTLNYAEIHLPGSTQILITFIEALDTRGTPPKVETTPPARRYKHVLLKSFLWMKLGTTTKHELLQRYPNPVHRDESFGEYVYWERSHPDFKGWLEIRFIFDGNVLEEIKATKEEK